MPKDRRSPQARSRAFMEDRGWIVAIVERNVAHRKAGTTHTEDAFGFGDLLCIRDGEAMLLQVTGDSGGNHAARRRKILSEDCRPALRAWLSTEGHTVEVQSWHPDKEEPRRERIDVD